MKNLTWQNPEQLFVAQELINKVKSKCCGIKVHKVSNLLHPIAPEVDINFYGSQAKENVGLDSDIGLLILVDKEKLSYDAEIFDALSHQSEEFISAIENF